MNWMDILAEFAASNIGDHERELLWARGVSDEQIVNFRVGYLNKVLPELPGSKAFQDWSGSGQKLNDCWCLPLTNALREIKGFQFRYVDRAKKGYMDFFPSSQEPVLFGLGEAIPHMWHSKTVILVEGGFDLWPIQRVYPHTVSILTAGIGEHLARLLRRWVDTVWLVLDNDAAGRRGAKQFSWDYREDFVIKDIELPLVKRANGGHTKDPSDLWEAWGDARLGVYLRELESPF